MVVGVYSMFDRITQSYSEPFVAVKKEVAIRRFNYIMSQSPMVSADMQLFQIGEFNTDTGSIVPSVEFICNYEVKDE